MPVYFTANNLPTREDLYHDEASILAGNVLLISILTSQILNHAALQDPAQLNDSFTQSLFIRAGTYTFSALGVTGPAYGRITWYLDNIAYITDQDWYSASLTYNTIKAGSVVIANDGYHVLKGVVASKNGSSSGYGMALTKYWFRQTAD